MTVTLLLGGCTHEETTEQDAAEYTDKPVIFMAAANDLTRGTAIQEGALSTSATFRVYATKQLKDGGSGSPGPELPFINTGESPGNVVSYQQIDGRWVWKTGTDYYWPQDNYFVNFYAIHPASAPVISDIMTSRSFTYDADTPIDGNHDLMFAQATTSLGSSEFKDINDQGTVALKFHHAFAQMAFYGKLSEQFSNFGWTLTVEDIVIYNVNAAGTFSFDTEEVTPNTTSPILSDYRLALHTGHLTITSTTATELLTSPNDVTMLMPQTLTAWDRDTESYLDMNGLPETTNSFLAIKFSVKDSNNQDPYGGSTTVYIPFAAEWEASNVYKYTVEFGGSYSVTAAIEPWATTNIEPTDPLYPDE